MYILPRSDGEVSICGPGKAIFFLGRGVDFDGPQPIFHQKPEGNEGGKAQIRMNGYVSFIFKQVALRMT